MNAYEELYYLLGRLEFLKEKNKIEPSELLFIQPILDRNRHFIILPPEFFENPNPEPEYYDESNYFGYKSWEELAFYEAFEGDSNAWNLFND